MHSGHPNSELVHLSIKMCDPELQKAASKIINKAVFESVTPCNECMQISVAKIRDGFADTTPASIVTSQQPCINVRGATPRRWRMGSYPNQGGTTSKKHRQRLRLHPKTTTRKVGTDMLKPNLRGGDRYQLQAKPQGVPFTVQVRNHCPQCQTTSDIATVTPNLSHLP